MQKKKKIKIIAGVMVLLLAVLVLWLIFRPKNPINYVTDTVSRADIEQTVNATGEIAASQLVDVGAQASGQIKKLYVTVGQQVKKGDLIAEIDSTTQLNTLNTNRAKLETYKAQLVSAQVQLRSAERQYKREQQLMAQDATSKQSVEDAQDAFATAKASVAELRSSIKQTQIAINTAEADLGYTRISSPLDGTIVSVPVEEGQTVNASQSTPTIVQVADLSKMLNKMQIAEGDVTKVKAGMPLTFTTLSDAQLKRSATLDSIDPGLTTMSQGSYDTSTDTTSTAIYYYARSLVPNADGKLHIGMTTQNSIVIKKVARVLTVANQAIQKQGKHQTVRVMDADKKVKPVAVTTGISDGMRTEIKSGLKEGDVVVLSSSSASAANNGSKQMRMGGPM